uniref:Rap-GAP domain-containing protein n=1 Tax=Paramoeba aestuarina TaxID=180227 RepID=A0A7S4K2Q2_9EUKA
MGDQFKTVDPSVISAVVESVAANVQKELSDYRNKSFPVDEPLVADQLYCLLEWLLVYGDHVCDHVKLIGKVCDALEGALVGVVKGDASMGASSRPSNRKRKSNVVRQSSTTADEAPFEVLYAAAINVVDPSTVMLPQVREAAENVVLHLLHFLHNVPGKEGIDILTSFIKETDDNEKKGSKCLHFVHNDNVLFSFVEVPTPKDDKKEENKETPKTFSRVIVRNSIGKYSWDTTRLFDYENMDELVSLPFQFQDDGVAQPPPVPRDGEAPLAPKPMEDHSEIPHNTNTYKTETDQLDVLLHYLSHTHPDCLPEGIKTLNVPADCAETQKKRIDYTEQSLVLQIEEDEQMIQKMQENVPPPQYWDMACPVPQLPVGTYHYCRTLLSHLGLLSCDNLGAISLLAGDPEKIERSLTQLDRTNSREMIKVGIIYLKEGQEEQYGVLANSAKDRTPPFYEFIRSIGWPIDLETHRAYMGGLDSKGTTGITAPYFATSTTEMIFHDITSMPTSSSEAGQLHKKRHVGNDHVHVVWTEHLRDYNPTTIQSEFNDVHIVVYPLSNGLFKIHVFQKENVELFGPLMHGMCVTKEVLPSLIRATCVMGNKYVRYTMEGYVTPYASRRSLLTQIVERHKADNDFRELIGSVF